MNSRPADRWARLVLLGVFAAWILAPSLSAQSSGDAKSSTSSDDNSAASDSANVGDSAPAKENPKSGVAPGMTKLRIRVTGNTDKPIGNASVYVRFPVSGGLLHHDKLAEMDLKTNQDGSVKVPEIPQGKIMVQVVAPGWHTYGKWYDVEQAEQTISIQLEPPPHWY